MSNTDNALPTPPEGTEQEPKMFDAEYVEKLRKEAADYRTKAKANAEAAEELAKLKEADKTEAQKAADRIAALEAENAKAQSALLRMRIAAKYGISTDPGEDGSPSDADLFLTGMDEESLTIQAERLAKKRESVTPPPRAAVVPNEGKNPTPGTDALREASRQLFNRS